MSRLRDTVQAEHSVGGAVFIARVANLATVNQSLGRKDTDELLRAFGRGLTSVVAQYPEALAARLNGQLCMLVPALCDPKFADQLFQAMTREAAPPAGRPSTWLGCGLSARGGDGDHSCSSRMALAAVEAEGSSGLKVVNLFVANDTPKTTDEWSRIIRRALDQKWVRLVSFPVLSLDGTLVHRECPRRVMFDEQGEWQPAGKFLPVAERLS
jgi:hypothetical protein